MKLLDRFRSKFTESQLKEEKIYEMVLNEINQGIRREGVWAKAIAKSEGNENKAKSLYIEFRAQSLSHELFEAEKKSLENAEQKRIAEKLKQSSRIHTPEELERIEKIKKATKYAGAKYIPD